MHIQESIAPQNANFYVIQDGYMATSEVSKIDKESAIGYANLIGSHGLKKSVIQAIDECENVYFFNRLNVPEKLRHQGLGKELLKHTLKYCLENKIVLINTANSYGDMKQSDLIKFYEDNGMVLIHAGGLLIYPSP